MTDLIYSPTEDGQVRLTEAHLGAVGVIHLSGFDSASAVAGQREIDDLVRLGIVDARGELDQPMVLLADTIAQPRREVQVRAAEHGRTHVVQGWASLHSVVLMARVSESPGLVDIDLMPSIDLPLAIARLVDLGPRPVVAADASTVRTLTGKQLERALSGDADADDGSLTTRWPEIAAVPVDRRRLWMVRSSPVGGDGDDGGFELAVADLGDGGLWLVGRENDDPTGDMEVAPASATSVWASLTILLRDLFSDDE